MKTILEKIMQKMREVIFGNNTIDYIVSLPSPLSQEEELATIALAEKGDEDARNKLVEHNLRLVVYIAKRFDNTGIDTEELISIGSIGLIKAVKSYNSDKNIKLATYASRCIENEILMYLRKMVRVKSEVSLDEPLNKDSEGNQLVLSDILGSDIDAVYNDMETKAETEILMNLFEQLNERDRAIIGLRYGLFGHDEKTQKEIADMMNISQSYISRLEKRVLQKLKKDFIKCE